LAGLGAVYGAWCARVPFDNLRKRVALFTGAPLPGGDAADFFEAWLEDGTGGTCWPTSNALHALLRSLGFEARRVSGSMRDIGAINHGSVKVKIEGRDWLVDSSLLTNVPLPLGPDVFVGDDPAFPVEVELDAAAHLIWVQLASAAEYMPCRLVEDPTSREAYLERYEASRQQSAFNQGLYARRNLPGEMLILRGRTLFARTAAGAKSTELSADGLREALRERFGISERAIDAWVRAGGLYASFAPPSGPKPPPPSKDPPSLRNPGGRAAP